jgi:hypothetical protein
MTAGQRVGAALVAYGVIVGTALDVPRTRPPLEVAGYQVLEADFHVHAFFGDGWLGPWDLVLEARRRNLHAFAITNHNQTLVARIGRWCANRLGGPIVLVGEEITAPAYHIAAVGLRSTVSWRQSAAGALDAIHAQGGVGIAAHPVETFWNGFDAAALRRLDGAEAAHPIAYSRLMADEIGAFWARMTEAGFHPAPIGSSDFHALSGFGICRTYVFVSERTEAGILDALRARRTVVFDPQGKSHGDPALVGPLREALQRVAPAEQSSRSKLADASGRLCGVIGLLILLLAPTASGAGQIVQHRVEGEHAAPRRDPLGRQNGA